MSIQAVNSSIQAFNSIKADFKAFRKDFGDLLSAEKTGTADQTTAAENALLKTIQQLQSDSSAGQQTAGSAKDTIKTDIQGIGSALQTVADAKQSGNQDQITTAEASLKAAVQQFQSDVSGVQKGHGHHHHHKTNSVQNAMQTDFQNLTSALQTSRDAIQSGDQTKIAASQDALKTAMQQLQTDIAGAQNSQAHHSRHHWANTAYANMNKISGSSATTQGSGVTINVQA